MVLIAAALTAVFSVLLGVLSASEAAVTLLPVGRIHRLEEAARSGARYLSELDEQENRLRGATALVAAIAYASGGVLGAVVGLRVSPASLDTVSALGGAVVATAVIFVFAQTLPRTVAVANPERVGLGTARVALAFTKALGPLARVAEAVWIWAVDLVGGERISSSWATEEAERGAPEPSEEAEREEAEEALLEAVSDFAEKIAREVMVPRPDVAALPDTASIAEAIAIIERRGFSRLPVYHESIDDVQGVLYAKDILITLGKGGDACTPAKAPIAGLVRDAIYVPETKSVEDLLVQMRRERMHIAIVTDEYGGTAGIVTLEDLLEEIVGEIADEYDREVPLVTDLGDGRFGVDARLPVDDLNERFGTAAEPEFDTVGGLVLEVAGHIPVVGESVEIDGVRLMVDHVEGNRIRHLVVEPVAGDDEGD